MDQEQQKFLEMMAAFAEVMAKGTSSAAKLGKSIEDLTKQYTDGKISWAQFNQGIKDQNKLIKDRTNPGLLTFTNNMLKGNKEFQSMQEEIKRLNKLIEDTSDVSAKARLIKERDELQRSEVSNRVNHSMVQFTSETGKIMVSGAAKAIGDFTKGLQTNSTGADLSSTVLKTAVDAAGKSTKAFSQGLSAVGATMITSGAPQVKALGVAASIAAPIIEALGSGASEAAKFGIDVLSTELNKTAESYIKLNQIGANFAGGMTEMKVTAASAGLSVDQFADVMNSARADLAQMGGGAREAGRRVAGISKELRTSELGLSLRKLGYSAEEQAVLGAQVAANLNVAGKLRYTSDKEVAKMTEEYGRDLRVLAGITGEDAKKKMEEARLKAQEADLYAEALRQGGPEAVLKLQRQFATMPDALKKGYMEFVSSGGQAITDVSTNIAMTQNPKVLEMYTQMFSTLGDGSKKASDAMDETGRLTEQVGKYAVENLENTKTIGTAARLTADSMLGGAADINNALIRTGLKITEGTTEGQREAADSAAKSADKLTNTIVLLEENTQKLKAALGRELIDPLTTFATILGKTNETMGSILDKVNQGLKETASISSGTKTGPSLGERALTAGAYATMGAGIGSAVPIIGTSAGAALGGIYGAFQHELNTGFSALGSLMSSWWSSKEGKARGGLAEGPNSGYLEKLHGTEAVIPTVGGKVPIDLRGDFGFGGLANLSDTLVELTKSVVADKVVSTTSTVTPLSARNETIEFQDRMLEMMAKFITEQQAMNDKVSEQIRQTEKLVVAST